MEINWRWGAVAGAGAFVISLFFGLFAGVFFGTLLLRALIGGVVFGALGLACGMLVARFLPELIEAPGEVHAAESAGGSVDITIQDDAASAESSYVETGLSERELLRPAMDVDSLVEEVEETTVADARAIESTAREEAPAASGPAVGRADVSVDFHDIDELPEIGGFSGSLVPERFAEAEEAKPRPRPGSGGSNPGAAGNNDPEALARAVQTLIRKDQKG